MRVDIIRCKHYDLEFIKVENFMNNKVCSVLKSFQTLYDQNNQYVKYVLEL